MYGNPFVWLIDTLITIFIYLLIAQAILSWLLAFGVVNRYNRGVAVIADFLYRVTEPALRPIRRFHIAAPEKSDELANPTRGLR